MDFSTDIIQKEYKPKKRGKGKLIFFLLVVFFLAGAIFYLGKLSNGKSVGTVKEGKKTLDLEKPDVPPEEQVFSGHHFSFTLPASYKEKRHDVSEKKDDTILEQTYFSQDSDPGRKFAVTISHLPANGMEGLSSWIIRRMHPEEYTRDVLQIKGMDVPIYLKESGIYEVTGYIIHGALVASVSISSAIEKPENLRAEFSSILSTFRWIE